MYQILQGLKSIIFAVTTIASLITFWACLRVLEKQRWVIRDYKRASWFYISAGIGIWAVAHAINLLYEYMGSFISAFSVADLVMYVGYILLLGGFHLSVKPITSIIKDTEISIKMVYVFTSLVGVLLIIMVLVYTPNILAERGLVAILSDTLYIIFDIAMLTTMLKIIVLYLGGSIAKQFAILAFGFAVITMGDFLLAITGDHILYNGLIRIVGYAILAAAIYKYSDVPPVV